ncbi:glycosyltransferase family 39 protein [Spongisporangium articulatum]|uniref:Glycosyltransferase family 39 protein n=1 Tax=Spongisporangium articulatum TaxID=3362603 RepID=A0ABW8AMP9_9ACTN
MRPGRQGGFRTADASSFLGLPRLPLGSWLSAGALFSVLALTAGRYGWHRDELYFVVAGGHPSWGYPDQPPLTPLLAAGWNAVVGGQLWLFRLLPALAVAGVVLVASATSARLGGDRRTQVATAVLTALTTAAVAMGHLFSTSTFTLLLTALTLLLLVRALQDGGLRAWLLTGLSAGVALQAQTLPALTLLACLVGVLVAGPREGLRRPGPWLAALLAALIAAPYLVWQAVHGWPQLEVAADIAAGGSTSSTPRAALIPMQLVMVGVFISPVLIAGVWALLRSQRLRAFRWLGLGFVVLLVLLVVLGGKAYYPSGFYPALLAAGADVTLRWMDGARRRRWTAGALVGLHALGTAVVCLPLAPEGSALYEVSVAANPDAGETVGWDRLTAQVGAVTSRVTAAGSPADETVLLTGNYGEAGALERARRSGADLPPVYSGHNAFSMLGPPPGSATTVVVVGYEPGTLGDWFTACRPVATIDTGVDNEEDGASVQVCTGLRRSWTQLWPQVTHYG